MMSYPINPPPMPNCWMSAISHRRPLPIINGPLKVVADVIHEMCQGIPGALHKEFFGKLLRNEPRVGAGVAWMWGWGPCGRPFLRENCSSEEKTYPCEVSGATWDLTHCIEGIHHDGPGDSC